MTDAYPTVVPMLAYEDGPAAMDWLADVFGFEERSRMIGSDGLLAHGEMAVGNGLIMLATPSPAYEGPKRHREHCAETQAWSVVPYVIDGVLVHVRDVERHYAQAVRKGAVILSQLEDGPFGKRYRAEDLEGHRWMFVE